MFFSGSTGLCGLPIPKCRGCRGPGGQEVHGLPQRGAPHAAQGRRGCHRQEEEQTRLLGKGNLGAINKIKPMRSEDISLGNNQGPTVSQDVQTWFPVQLAFDKFLSKIKGNF